MDVSGSDEEEAVVRTLQLEEDEATARSLQVGLHGSVLAAVNTSVGHSVIVS